MLGRCWDGVSTQVTERSVPLAGSSAGTRLYIHGKKRPARRGKVEIFRGRIWHDRRHPKLGALGQLYPKSSSQPSGKLSARAKGEVWPVEVAELKCVSMGLARLIRGGVVEWIEPGLVSKYSSVPELNSFKSGECSKAATDRPRAGDCVGYIRG